MDEIADWLNRLGISKYAERFAKNDIDLTILAHFRRTWRRSESPRSAIAASSCAPSPLCTLGKGRRPPLRL
jgi:SAM domain (Sterile alpha motif)